MSEIDMVQTTVPVDIDHLKSWVGNQDSCEDVVSRSSVGMLAALLDHSSLPNLGDPLGPLWHWALFKPLSRQSELSIDGHPRRGDFLPPVPLQRRMWAGGRLAFYAPITIGESVTRTTEITDVTHKIGKQGDLVFLTLRHTIETLKGIAIEEEQDIVYRAPGRPFQRITQSGSAKKATIEIVHWREPILPTATLLMRYSGVTFNAHRIHYDLPYAGEEGYPGLVVHGPLIATLLVDQLTRHVSRRLTAFSFRALRPLFADEVFHLCGRRGDKGEYLLWAEALDGSAAMTATASVEG